MTLQPPPPLPPDQERALSMAMTVYSFAETWASNGCANLTALARWPSVARLVGKFDGVPAVILSPGPSLSKNVELVKPLKGKVLIVAFTRTLSALDKVGLVPDLTVQLDPLDLTYHLDNYDVSKLEGLVVGATCNPKLYQMPFRRVFPYSGNQVIESWIYDALDGPDMFLDTSCSVATTTISLCKLLGCSPIVLVGQDMSFPDGKYYDDGTEDGGARLEPMPQLTPEQQAEEDSILRTLQVLAQFGDQVAANATQQIWNQRNVRAEGAQVVGMSRHAAATEATGKAVLSRIGHVVKVPGYYGGKVGTTPSFSWVREWMGKRAAEFPGRFINATEGGCFIDGMIHAPLKTVIEGGIVMRGTEIHAHLSPLPLADIDVPGRLQAACDSVDVPGQRKALLDMAIKTRAALVNADWIGLKLRQMIDKRPDTDTAMRRVKAFERWLCEELDGAEIFYSIYQQQVIDAILEPTIGARTFAEIYQHTSALCETVHNAREFGETVLGGAIWRLRRATEEEENA